MSKGGLMRIIQWLDMLLVFYCEGVAHKVQRFCGWDNFHLARLCLFSGYILDSWTGEIPIMVLLMGVVCLINNNLIKSIEKMAQQSLRMGYRNFQMLYPKGRVLLLLFSPVVTLMDPSDPDFYMLGTGFAYYFAACTSLPPAESKVKQFFKSLIAGQKPQPVTQHG